MSHHSMQPIVSTEVASAVGRRDTVAVLLESQLVANVRVVNICSVRSVVASVATDENNERSGY